MDFSVYPREIGFFLVGDFGEEQLIKRY